MKKIYETSLYMVNEKYIHTRVIMDESVSYFDYDSVYSLIADDYLKFLSTIDISTEYVDKNNLKEINGLGNNKILVPQKVFYEYVYVTKTIFPNIVREVVTGKLFAIAGYYKKLRLDNICVVDIINSNALIKDEEGFKKLKNYIINFEAIKYKIALATEKTKDLYLEAEEKKNELNELRRNKSIKCKEEEREKKKIINNEKKDLKKLLKHMR